MALNKVEICGVNTSKLPVLTAEEKAELFRRIKSGDEQARELALEGQRWYFLKRHGILIDQVKKYAGDPRISTSIAGRVNLPKNPHFVRWPIPEAEVINMGPENFPQNEGYN